MYSCSKSARFNPEARFPRLIRRHVLLFLVEALLSEVHGVAYTRHWLETDEVRRRRRIAAAAPSTSAGRCRAACRCTRACRLRRRRIRIRGRDLAAEAGVRRIRRIHDKRLERGIQHDLELLLFA